MAKNDILTKRQIEMLVHIGNGLKREQVARSCGVSAWTVKATLDGARSRLGVRTTNQAILKGIALHLIVVDSSGRVYVAGSP